MKIDEHEHEILKHLHDLIEEHEEHIVFVDGSGEHYNLHIDNCESCRLLKRLAQIVNTHFMRETFFPIEIWRRKNKKEAAA